MLRKFLTIATIVAPFTTVFSQDSTTTATPPEKKGALTISGSVDAYYRYNFSNPKNVLDGDGKPTFYNNYTSFTNSQNSFELGMASVKADYSIGKVAATVDLGFGKRAQDFSYNDAGALAAIKQAYVSYAPSDKFKLTMGKWGTHVGYEVLDAYLNRNYSMSYMFSYGPFFHTGIKADVTLGNVGLMLGVVNPTDRVTASFEKKYVIGQVSAATSNSKLKAYLNYVGGKDMSNGVSNQFDLVVMGTVSDKFSVGYNGTVQNYKPSSGSSASWWGSAVYLNVDPTSMFGLTLRGEYFDNKKEVLSLYGTSIFDATLSANIKIDNLTIIPEFRLDSAKDPIFYKKGDDPESPSGKSTGSFILAVTYHF